MRCMMYGMLSIMLVTGDINVDYGENTVFFIVKANNFVDSWHANFPFHRGLQ